MPIKPDTPNTDASPFYEKMKQKAENWNQFALEIGANLEGSYNAYHINFEMTALIKGSIFTFKGRRQLHTVSSGLFPLDGEIVEELLIFCGKENLSKQTHFRIKPTTLFNQISRLWHRYNFCKSKSGFTIQYNSEHTYEELVDSNVLGFNALKCSLVDRKGFLLQMLYLPSELKSLRKIKWFCDKFYK